MALDIRLDFPNMVAPLYIKQMRVIRNKFIDIDNLLKLMTDEAIGSADEAAKRTIALSRTFNEQACQSAIKSICLLGEIKE